MLNNKLVFHANKSIESKKRSHTLVFQKGPGNTLYVTYSKPRTGVDSYCRKTGTEIASVRMVRFSESMNQHIINVKNDVESENVDINTISYKELFNKTSQPWVREIAYARVSPTIVKTLAHYTQRALRYFDLEKANVIIRGENDKVLKIRNCKKQQKQLKEVENV